MPVVNKNEFSSDVVKLSDFAKVFSHPARVMIIEALAEQKDLSTKDLVEKLPLSQATVSQHLKELRELNLICRRARGVQSIYCLQWNQMEHSFDLFDKLRSSVMASRPKRNCC